MDIQKALQELCNEVKQIIKYRIVHYGVNPKTGTNTLQGSELENSIDIRPLENGFALSIADYWEFVSLGWHRSHRFEGTMNQFVRNIDDWIRRKGIRLGNLTQAQMVFVIIRNTICAWVKLPSTDGIRHHKEYYEQRIKRETVYEI